VPIARNRAGGASGVAFTCGTLRDGSFAQIGRDLRRGCTSAEQPDGPDTITVNPWGGLVIAEDGEGTQHLVAIVDGAPFPLARNALSGSEFTGVNFSPDRHTLFANIQDEGYVFAIHRPLRPAAAGVTRAPGRPGPRPGP
jgi:secreted PhoX family phosphatase